MNGVILFLLVSTMLIKCQSRGITCSKKAFVCYDETRYYQCAKTNNGDHSIKGYLQTCPLGLVCNDLNDFECEEDIFREFLMEQKYRFKFDGKDGRKQIIDD